MRARRSGDVDVVVGVNALSEPVIQTLAIRAQDSRTRRVIALSHDDEYAVPELRTAGVIIADLDPLRDDELLAVLTRRGEQAARRVYVLTDSGDYNRQVAETARQILEEQASPGNTTPTVLVRLDDPREADSWRVGHALGAHGVVMDAVSAIEVTAGQLVDLLTNEGVRRVNLVGDGPVSFAVLNELAARHAWHEALADSSSPVDDPLPLPESLLTGLAVRVFTSDLDAEVEWQLLRKRAEKTHSLPDLVVTFESTEPRIDDLVPPTWFADVATVFVGAPEPSVLNAASRLARLRPRSIVLAPDDHVIGVALTASHGRLYRYGLSLNPHDNALPPGGWDRMGRLQHEVYRQRTLARGQTPRPTQRPWNELDETVRWSNAEQIRSVMRSVRELGYTWVADATDDDPVALSSTNLMQVAERMHEEWLEAKRAAGFIYGTPSNPTARPPTSSYLVPWEDLNDKKKRENLDQVAEAISRALVFGLTLRQGSPAQRGAK